MVQIWTLLVVIFQYGATDYAFSNSVETLVCVLTVGEEGEEYFTVMLINPFAAVTALR